MTEEPETQAAPPSSAPSEKVREAGRWLASSHDVPHPVIPALRSRFGLSAAEAVQACREATLIRGRAL